MKTKLLLASLFVLTVQQATLAQTDVNGYNTVNLSMGPTYQNRVFFDFSANNVVSHPANAWDIAFYRNSAMDFGTRINDAQTIQVYEASNVPTNWNTIDLANISSWGAPKYNPDITTSLKNGAFEQGSAQYGWGQYNVGNHHVEGKVIFVLKYVNTDQYIKFMIDDYFGGYTFKYSKWNAASSTWEPTVTKTIANGTDDAYFNYFSFTTGEKVANLEPSKANWDLMFTRFYTDFVYPGGSMMYKMAGILQSPTVSVAKVQPETQETSTAVLPTTSFSNNIATIGYSWKPTSGAPHSNVVYYIKQGSEYYRMYFLTNGGEANGNMYFKYKNITSVLGVTEVGKKVSFGIYPNPTTSDKRVTVLYDVKEKAGNKGNVEVYDLTGKRVHQSELTNQAGFYKQELNLSHLPAGNYIVKITFGGQTETKKLIVK